MTNLLSVLYLLDFAEYESSTVISLIILLSVIFTALSTLTDTGRSLLKVIWAKIRSLVFIAKRVNEHDDLLQNIDQKLDTVIAELKVNGGSSLRDVLNTLMIDQLAEIGSRRAMFSDTVAFWESDANGQCVYASDKLAEYVGQNPEDILGSGWVTTLHVDDVRRVSDAWDFAVQQRRAFLCDYRFVHQDGTEVLVQGHCHPILNKRREIVKFVGLLTLKSITPP